MSEANGGPPVIEAGRYAVRVAGPDWQLNRATGLCDRCQSCGCGEQADPVALPDFSKGKHHLVSWAMAHMADLRAVLNA
jgi:hypothetical protein